MAFRGRGRGFGGGGFRIAKKEPVEKKKPPQLQDIEDFIDAKSVIEEETLFVWNSRLQEFWNSSPYYINDEDKDKPKRENETKRKRPKLLDFMTISNEYVLAELVAEMNSESKQEESGKKKVQWKLNPDSDLQKLDLFEKLDQKYQVEDEKGEKGKKEDEEEEDDEIIEEEDEEFSDDGDYNQNIDFDDDEDDFNIKDDNDGEEAY